MSSKEKLKKDFTKTLKTVYKLKSSLEKKKTQMYKLGKTIYDNNETTFTRENAKLFVDIVPKMTNNLAELTVKNKILLDREKKLFTDTMLNTLNSKLIVKNLQEDATVKNWKKNDYTKKFNSLNDSILLNISLLDLEFTKLEHLYDILKKRKISIKVSR